MSVETVYGDVALAEVCFEWASVVECDDGELVLLMTCLNELVDEYFCATGVECVQDMHDT